MGNQCSQCCTKDPIYGTVSSNSSVYRKRRRSRGEIPIESSDRFKITQTSNAVQLALEHVQRDDAGHYTLYARTKTGNLIQKDVELIVEDRSIGDDPPIFLRRLNDLTVKVGTRTRLLVEIRSSTDVRITWYRNDRRICENDRIKQVNEGNFYCLEIAPIILEDGGQWMCQAENLGGRNSCIALLNVLVPKAYKPPEFMEPLRAVLTEQGTVSLECKVIGVPTPILRWFKDSKEIKAGDIFALTANPEDPTSLGTYTCEAINCMGKAYSSSKVHVVGKGSREGSLKPADSLSNVAPPPIFTNELKGAKVRIGDTIMLGCQVVVPPWPKSVVWYNKEGRVEQNERYKQIEDGLGVYMVEIKPSESCDEGEWKCVVTSAEGSIGISSCTVEMEIPKNYRKPRFMESLKAVLTEEGLVSFECKVVGFPTPTLKWFKDGQELKPGDVYQLTGTNSLGTYCCVAKNCMGECSSVAVLTVEDIQNQLTEEERSLLSQRNQPPKFMVGLKSQEIKINEPFRFNVVVNATPEPILSWFRDELPIESSERYLTTREENDNWYLEIQCVEFVDQAEWKCVATNDFGTSVTSCFIKLQVPRHYKKPRFLECLRAVLTEEGAVNLECKVIGVPQPILKWYKDGVELKPGDIHRIISGQDGTCCLGTYTCEARNCMGVVASSASLLGFEDAYKAGNQQETRPHLQRNISLSTIQEERTSQLYETPTGDITLDDKADVSFSFEGKEVSVSLYETPDLTEEEALQIVEMYADQISDHVTEDNIVELPPLRFVKETSQSGNLLMEAMVIDISPEYFSHEEDLRTEAGMEDISICEVSLHQLSSMRDESVSTSADGIKPPQRKKKKAKAEQEEFYSFSQSKVSGPSGSSHGGDDDTETDLQTFASAQDSLRTGPLESEQEVPNEENALRDFLNEHDVLEAMDTESSTRLKRKHGEKRSVATGGLDSPKSQEMEAKDISGEEGDGLRVAKMPKLITDENMIRENLQNLIPMAKSLNMIQKNLHIIQNEVITQSAMMMSPASAEQSIRIISNLLAPLKQIQSKLKVYSGEIPIETLFETIEDDIKEFYKSLQVVEKCVEMDEGGMTLIQRTSVFVIDCSGSHIVNCLDELRRVAQEFEKDRLRTEISLLAEDMKQGVQITQDTIKTLALMQEASALEAAQHFEETVAKIQNIPEVQSFEKVTAAVLPPEAEALTMICRPVVKIRQALESIEHDFSLEENEEQLFTKIHETFLAKLTEPVEELQSEVQKLEQKSNGSLSRETLEQKINISILDVVSPPLFELRKGLEILSQQSSGNIHSGMVSVSIIESMVAPLQEIENGLAQLGQDIESGQIGEEVNVENADTQKLLQSIAQGVLNFESNIDHLPLQTPKEIKDTLFILKDNISNLIGNILDSSLNKYHITLLENMKRPIDELNYCLRQTEEKSISGSLKELVEPLQDLYAKANVSEDILLLTGQSSKDSNIIALEHIKEIVRQIRKDIENYEVKLVQEEMEKRVHHAELKQPEEPSLQEVRSLSKDEQVAAKAVAQYTLEELHLCVEEICERIVFQKAEALSSPTESLSALKRVATPLQDFLKCIAKMKEVVSFENVESLSQKGDIVVLQQLAKPIQSVLETFMTVKEQRLIEQATSISSQEAVSLLKTLAIPLQELHQCIETIEQKSGFSETLHDVSEIESVKLIERVNEFSCCLEQILHQIAEPVEDISTGDEISALKTMADVIPIENKVAYMETAEVIEDVASLESFSAAEKSRAQLLIEELRRNIAEVLQFEKEENITMMKIEKQPELNALLVQIKNLENMVATVQSQSIHEPLVSLSTEESLKSKSICEALVSLQSCVMQIQDELALDVEGSLSTCSNISQLKTLAQPLNELKQSLEIVHHPEVVESLQEISSSIEVSRGVAVVKDLYPLIVEVNKAQILEGLKDLVKQEEFSSLQRIIEPLQLVQESALMVEEQHHLSQAGSLTSEEGCSKLATIAEPLLILKEAIISIQDSYHMESYKYCPAFNAIKDKLTPVYNLLEYVQGLNSETLENLQEMSTQEDISALKTLAEATTISELQKVEVASAIQVEEGPQIPVLQECLDDGLKNVGDCLELVTNQNKNELDEVLLITVENSLKDLKEAFKLIQEEISSSEILVKSDEEKRSKLSGPLLKLRECLVHTYEATEQNEDVKTSLDSGLKDIEKSFKDIMNNIPGLEVVLATEMVKISLDNIDSYLRAVNCSPLTGKELFGFQFTLDPLQTLSRNLFELQTCSECQFAKNSDKIISLQSCLLAINSSLNDVRRNIPEEFVKPLRDCQQRVNNINNLIESFSETVWLISLVEEINCFTGSLTKLNALIENYQPVRTEEEISNILKPVDLARDFLLRMQTILNSYTDEEIKQFLQEFGNTVEDMKSKLILIEEILSKYDEDIRQITNEDIQIISGIEEPLQMLNFAFERFNNELENRSKLSAKEEKRVEEIKEMDTSTVLSASDVDVKDSTTEEVTFSAEYKLRGRQDDAEKLEENETSLKRKMDKEDSASEEKKVKMQGKASEEKEIEMKPESSVPLEVKPASKPEDPLISVNSNLIPNAIEIVKNCVNIIQGHDVADVVISEEIKEKELILREILKQLSLLQKQLSSLPSVNDESEKSIKIELVKSLIKLEGDVLRISEIAKRRPEEIKHLQKQVSQMKNILDAFLIQNPSLKIAFSEALLQKCHNELNDVTASIEKNFESYKSLHAISTSFKNLSNSLEDILKSNKITMEKSSSQAVNFYGLVMNSFITINNVIEKEKFRQSLTENLEDIQTKLISLDQYVDSANKEIDLVDLARNINDITTLLNCLNECLENEQTMTKSSEVKSIGEEFLGTLLEMKEIFAQREQVKLSEEFANVLKAIETQVKIIEDDSSEEIKKELAKKLLRLRECIVHTYEGSAPSDPEENEPQQFASDMIKKFLKNSSDLKILYGKELFENCKLEISKYTSISSEIATEHVSYSELTLTIHPLQSLSTTLQNILHDDRKDEILSDEEFHTLRDNISELQHSFNVARKNVPFLISEALEKNIQSITKISALLSQNETNKDILNTIDIVEYIREPLLELSDILESIKAMNAEPDFLVEDQEKQEKAKVKKQDIDMAISDKSEEKAITEDLQKCKKADLSVSDITKEGIKEETLFEVAKQEKKVEELAKLQEATVSELNVKAEEMKEGVLDSSSNSVASTELIKSQSGVGSKKEDIEEEMVEGLKTVERKDITVIDSDKADVSTIELESEATLKDTEKKPVKAKSEKIEQQEVFETMESVKLEDLKKSEMAELFSSGVEKADIQQGKVEVLDKDVTVLELGKSEKAQTSISAIKHEEVQEGTLQVSAQESRLEELGKSQKEEVSSISKKEAVVEKYETEQETVGSVERDAKTVELEKSQEAEKSISALKDEKIEESTVKKFEQDTKLQELERPQTAEVSSAAIEKAEIAEGKMKSGKKDAKTVELEKFQEAEKSISALKDEKIEESTVKKSEQDTKLQELERPQTAEVSSATIEKGEIAEGKMKSVKKDAKTVELGKSQEAEKSISALKDEKIEESTAKKSEQDTKLQELERPQTAEVSSAAIEKTEIAEGKVKSGKKDAKTVELEKSQEAEKSISALKDEKIEESTVKTSEQDTKLQELERPQTAEVSGAAIEKAEIAEGKVKSGKKDAKTVELEKSQEAEKSISALKNEKIEESTVKKSEQDTKLQELERPQTAEVSSAAIEKAEIAEGKMKSVKKDAKTVEVEKSQEAEKSISALKDEKIEESTVKKSEQDIKLQELERSQTAEVSSAAIEKAEIAEGKMKSGKKDAKTVELEKSQEAEKSISALKDEKIEELTVKKSAQKDGRTEKVDASQLEEIKPTIEAIRKMKSRKESVEALPIEEYNAILVEKSKYECKEIEQTVPKTGKLVEIVPEAKLEKLETDEPRSAKLKTIKKPKSLKSKKLEIQLVEYKEIEKRDNRKLIKVEKIVQPNPQKVVVSFNEPKDKKTEKEKIKKEDDEAKTEEKQQPESSEFKNVEDKISEKKINDEENEIKLSIEKDDVKRKTEKDGEKKKAEEKSKDVKEAEKVKKEKIEENKSLESELKKDVADEKDIKDVRPTEEKTSENELDKKKNEDIKAAEKDKKKSKKPKEISDDGKIDATKPKEKKIVEKSEGILANDENVEGKSKETLVKDETKEMKIKGKEDKENATAKEKKTHEIKEDKETITSQFDEDVKKEKVSEEKLKEEKSKEKSASQNKNERKKSEDAGVKEKGEENKVAERVRRKSVKEKHEEKEEDKKKLVDEKKPKTEDKKKEVKEGKKELNVEEKVSKGKTKSLVQEDTEKRTLNEEATVTIVEEKKSKKRGDEDEKSHIKDISEKDTKDNTPLISIDDEEKSIRKQTGKDKKVDSLTQEEVKNEKLTNDVHPKERVDFDKGTKISTDKYKEIDNLEEKTKQLQESTKLKAEDEFSRSKKDRDEKKEIKEKAITEVKRERIQNGDLVERSTTRDDKSRKHDVDDSYVRKEKRISKRAPSINLKLTNRTAQEGSNIKLTCSFSGEDVSTNWGREGAALTLSPGKYSVTCQNGICSLEIENVTKSDSGIYSCILSNRNGEVETSCLVTIYEPPSEMQNKTPPIFTRRIQDSYLSHSNEIVLECKLHGIPVPEIVWYKNDVKIENSDKFRIVEHPDGLRQLIISNPTIDDTALYTCYAENCCDKSKLSKSIDVTDHIRIESPRLMSRRLKKTNENVEDLSYTRSTDSLKESDEMSTRRKLYIESPLKHVTVPERNEARLSCFTNYERIDEVKWLKDGHSIRNSSKYRISNENGYLSLEIARTSPDDSGEYECVIRSGREKISTKSKLIIYKKVDELHFLERFSRGIKESYDENRDELILECIVQGQPINIVWMKNGSPITNNRFRSVEDTNGIRRLIIRNPIITDLGLYSCRLEENDRIEELSFDLNENNFKSSSSLQNNSSSISGREATPRRPILPALSTQEISYQRDTKKRPVFSTMLRDRTATENSTIKLTCNILGNDTEVSWLRNNLPLPPSTRYRANFDDGLATLEIFSAQPEDSGDYTCVASNNYGESYSYAQLKVHKGYNVTPMGPVFTRTIKDTYFLNENQLVLDCRVRGNPRPEVQWLRNNDLIIPDEKYIQLDQADGYCKLIVNNPTERDSGVYTCSATNSVNTDKITHTVEFAGQDSFILEKTHGFFHRDPNKPHFANSLGNHIVTAGGTIAIQAEFAPTKSPIEVQWLKNKEPITPGLLNVKTFVDHGVYTLAIQQATPDFSGTYTCRASNAFGRVESNANVHIIGATMKGAKPALFLSRPETEMKIAVNDPFSISFRVQGEPKPKLILMKGTKDITRSDRVSKEAQEDYIRFTVHKAQVLDSGTYFVVARNEHGTDRIFVTVTIKNPKKKI